MNHKPFFKYYSWLKISFTGAIPQKDVQIQTLPVSETLKLSDSSPVIKIGVRKIPFTIHHNGKQKHFVVEETKTLEHLQNEIKRLGCHSPFDISTISAKENPGVLLKYLNLPSFNKIIIHCKDKTCQENFNSDMLVKSTSDHLRIAEVSWTLSQAIYNFLKDCKQTAENCVRAAIRKIKLYYLTFQITSIHTCINQICWFQSNFARNLLKYPLNRRECNKRDWNK